MTESIWTPVPESDADTRPPDHIDHGRWGVPEDGPVVSAHERQIEAAKEDAAAFFISQRLAGGWAPRPDLASWPSDYRQAFEDELARLEADRLAELARREVRN